MANLIRLGEAAPKYSFVHFNRTELTLLLNLYARRVSEGAWRDYAIDQGGECAVFSIYRHTLDRPVFTITKLTGTKLAGTKRAEYVAATAERELARSASLAEALAALERAPRLIDPQS
jgi:hypothetical protein